MSTGSEVTGSEATGNDLLCDSDVVMAGSAGKTDESRLDVGAVSGSLAQPSARDGSNLIIIMSYRLSLKMPGMRVNIFILKGESFSFRSLISTFCFENLE